MAAAPPERGESLSVIALISGGKDSFYSILHCQANGHRVVALANLYPSGATDEAIVGADQHQIPPSGDAGYHGVPNAQPAPQQLESFSRLSIGNTGTEDDGSETDLNSFMYQTVGHQVIPLYARATGLPLYRQPIVGTAVHHGLSYEGPDSGSREPASSNVSAPNVLDDPQPGNEKTHEPEVEDETESLVPLLRAVLKAHPEANALCTGAILSTYQRTRVESVALRLDLVPLSYLWQFTELPQSLPTKPHEQGTNILENVTWKNRYDARKRARRKGQGLPRDDARLLRDMAAVGLEARIVKVASAGLDEGFLWENVSSEAGVRRVEHAMRRFGAAGGRGSLLGEGGEFETLVIDGPSALFKGRIVVSDSDRRVVREGGGCAWLSFRRADVVLKDEPEQAGEFQTQTLAIQIPALLDPRFDDTIRCLLAPTAREGQKLGSVNLSPYDGSTKPDMNPGSTSVSYSIIETDMPKCQMPLSPQSSSSQEWNFHARDGAKFPTVEDQTVSIVNQIRCRLDECALPATAITNSLIALRRMSDFPIVNKHYGSLFRAPNPPSRVTIACGGELLPKDAAIAVYLTVQSRLQCHERRGLHVQSRSYWAPANIGPYSQAIAFPLLALPITEAAITECGETEDEPRQDSRISGSPLAVSIAGQIPLVPASMALPLASTPNYVELQITLALQHLWRVGVEMQVRWWTSVVAYFSAASSTTTMQQQALLAAAAWRVAHLWPELDIGQSESDKSEVSDDDDDDGPDLWDRRYNARFMTYGGGDEEESFPLSLPNWSVLKGLDVDEDDAEVLLKHKIANNPFFFAAEVEELPRQACVEWHAHLGLAELQPASVTLYPLVHGKIPMSEDDVLHLELYHTIVDTEDAVFVQTTAALLLPASYGTGRSTSISTDVLRSVSTATATSLEKLLSLPSRLPIRPKITYSAALQLAATDELEEIGALIPCRSLWDSRGCGLSAVCIFETRAAKVK
ncbi:hypothetical protein F4777DRAFT_510288 [Nemania sp. FL0916]|nr:hypothetical protein F4777DRAFT_510288 [Nemania sp. FL0916]